MTIVLTVLSSKTTFFSEIVFNAVKISFGVLLFGYILKPKPTHCKEQRGRRRDNETDSLGATSIDKIGEVWLSDEIGEGGLKF